MAVAMIVTYNDMIMPMGRENQVRERRLARRWTQAELAARAGISRAAVSAIEGRRLVPSVAAALQLSEALHCSVEDLFGTVQRASGHAQWAWPAMVEPSRYWKAQVGPKTLLYPVEPSPTGVPHDGVFSKGQVNDRGPCDPRDTLVMACCDPAAGLLATQYARTAGLRLLVLNRSSQRAMELLRLGLVHVGGIHVATAERPGENAEVVRSKLGAGYQLVRIAQWQEGVAFGARITLSSVRAALRSDITWIGRDHGSAAGDCLEKLLGGRRRPRRVAHDHRGVAEAVRCGWADAGVCVRLVSEEAGIGFIPVREECFDLCFSATIEGDPRVQALLRVIRSAAYRRILGELPGYDASETGETESIR